ncbi:choice-of-anchor P family protein [Kribbella deserti]|uniref:Choice-of-anchor P family protein n=1 Tax=Kribbella deserti TaxID=1926257 RepID=A0ABV6QEF2_9ACTN
MTVRTRIRALTAASVALVVAGSSLVAATLPANASAQFGYSGYAHGTLVASGLVNSGPQAASFFGCTRQVPLFRSNTLASAVVGGQALAHTVATRTFTHNDSRGDGTTSFATAANIRIGLLFELVGAQSYSQAVYKNGKFQMVSGSRFAGVKIAGLSVPGLLNPAPNTTVNVPGLGFLQLNRTIKTQTPQSATASSVAVLIHSTVSNPYLPKGATIALLLTSASVGGPSTALLRGKAYTTQVNVGNIVTSGPTSLQTTCYGTNGALRTVNVAGLTVPNVVTVNGLSTSQAGSLRPTIATGNMSATVASVNLGNGAVKLSAVTARTSATKTGGRYYTSWSTSIGSLVINGRSVPVPTAPNQQINVAGLGTLTFNKLSRTTGWISVTAVELRITALNTTVQISHAESGIVG